MGVVVIWKVGASLAPLGVRQLLRVMVEGRDADVVADQAEAIASTIRRAMDRATLNEEA